MDGNGARTDSFDSTDLLCSNNGFYPAGDLHKLLSNGDVYVNSSLVGAADVGTAEIYGHRVVGPHGVRSLGPNGGVATYEWRNAGNTGILAGHFRDGSNFTFPDVELPYSFGATPTSGTISMTNISMSSGTTTSASCPNPAPASVVIANISYATTSIAPNPMPDGMVVDIVTDPDAKSGTYPADENYVGEVSKHGKLYYYEAITATTYTYPLYSYS